jgi:hypothetical protein
MQNSTASKVDIPPYNLSLHLILPLKLLLRDKIPNHHLVRKVNQRSKSLKVAPENGVIRASGGGGGLELHPCYF